MERGKFTLHIPLGTKKLSTLCVNVNTGRYGGGVCVNIKY